MHFCSRHTCFCVRQTDNNTQITPGCLPELFCCWSPPLWATAQPLDAYNTHCATAPQSPAGLHPSWTLLLHQHHHRHQLPLPSPQQAVALQQPAPQACLVQTPTAAQYGAKAQCVSNLTLTDPVLMHGTCLKDSPCCAAARMSAACRVRSSALFTPSPSPPSPPPHPLFTPLIPLPPSPVSWWQCQSPPALGSPDHQRPHPHPHPEQVIT